MGLSEAQKRANIKYLKKHPDKQKVYRYRSNARTFIRKYASIEDLDNLQQLIDQQREQLSKQ